MRNLFSVLFLLPFAASACDGLSGGLSGSEMGQVTVALTSASAPASSSAGLIQFSLDGNVPAEAVGSIDVEVTGVQARHTAPEDLEGAWFDIPLPEGVQSVPVNLWDLANATVELATGEVPTGQYADVRLFFDEATATITTTAEICLDIDGGTGEGPAQRCLEPGAYPLFIPSGAETGVKTGAGFEVNEGQQSVTLEFDEDATVQTLAWAPGLNKIVMNPVIRAAGEAGE